MFLQKRPLDSKALRFAKIIRIHPCNQGAMGIQEASIQSICQSLFEHLSIQWVISEFACYTYSMVAVPLYDTLGAEAVIYIINKGKTLLLHFNLILS